MRVALVFPGSMVMAMAFACAACSGGGDPVHQIQTAFADAASQNSTAAGAAATATNVASAAGVTVPTAGQVLTLAQIAAANHLTAAQVVQIQTMLNQGTANDKLNGLSAAQQADNTQRRLAVLAVLFGQNPGVAVGQ